ncbi:50S ribosomal protein L11 methyltransferase [Thiomicrospira sp. WB1]|uniref:50S ribosomal protein L11 methyltransferase n=1 Tax=Thiomicrospira sp. WB1 TaxID=1685380 RepID=UPI000745F567|nr:50S ribosomal protein L11 methyltransferase [Thiomicrospira sp. WB1]KUJ72705.1 ribosomal protein L11 methyltransferase [Thiomicrospira sp. WB1]
MAWIQIKATVNETLADPLSDAFSEQGAASVTFADAADQPIFEPELGTTPIWQRTQVIALFDAATDVDALLTQVLAAPTLPDSPGLVKSDFTIEPLEDKDWVRAWMDAFEPMQFGQRLWIVPSWHQPPDPQAVNLMLDPGMAFGTGTHPTTALCLQWLDAHSPVDQSVVDYGCGSGVLALAATKLGARSVSGTDIDPQAIRASRDNAERNQADITFELVEDFEATSPQPADLVIANILAGPLKSLRPNFQSLLKPEATLVLSGLLTTQVDDLLDDYTRHGFQCLAHNTLEDWSQLTLQAPS